MRSRRPADGTRGGDTAFVTDRAAIEAEISGLPRSLTLVFLNAWTRTPKEIHRVAVDAAAHHIGSDWSLLLRSLDDDQPRAATVSLSGPLG